MNILFVSSGNSQFGISPIVINQGESLKNSVNVDFYVVKGKGIQGYYKNIPLLRDKLSKKKYDIIHAHYGLCGILSECARKKEKLVVSFMGSDLIGSNEVNGSYSLKRKFIVKINKYFAKNRYNYNIVKSRQMRIILKNSENVEIIPNGVDLQRFYPMDKQLAKKNLNLNSKKKYILFAANPKKDVKNYPLAEKAFAIANLKNVELKIVNNVTQQILNSYYNAVDLLLLTSFHEGSPNIIKEAMACNCPIVSTDVGDVKDVIENTEGCYIASHDEKDVAMKTGEALKFAKRTNGRKHIKHLEASIIADKIIKVYEQILS